MTTTQIPKKKPRKLEIIEIEFIEASKSANPLNNVLELYKTHYVDIDTSKSLDSLVEILSNILEAVTEIKLSKILSNILPSNYWKSQLTALPEKTLLNEIIVRYLLSEIQMIPQTSTQRD
jgi:hypothetical protein